MTRLTWTAPLVLTCGYAVLKGGRVEREAAAVFLAGDIATALVKLAPHGRSLHLGWFVVDLAVLTWLTWRALQSDRWWPMLAASLQLCAVLTYIATALDRRVWALVYFQVSGIWSYGILACLVFGVAVEQSWRRRAAAMA